jgi:hypothetical protein
MHYPMPPCRVFKVKIHQKYWTMSGAFARIAAHSMPEIPIQTYRPDRARHIIDRGSGDSRKALLVQVAYALQSMRTGPFECVQAFCRLSSASPANFHRYFHIRGKRPVLSRQLAPMWRHVSILLQEVL